MPTDKLNPLMTIQSTHTTAYLKDTQAMSLNSPLDGTTTQHLVDIHPALEQVRNLPDFTPEKPPFWEKWLEGTPIPDLLEKIDDILDQLKETFTHYLNQHVESASQAIPQNIIDTISFSIGVLIVLGIIFLFYILLNSLKRLVFEKEATDAQSSSRQKTIKASDYHFKLSQQYLKQQKTNQATHQLYLAWLASFDEKHIIEFDESRSNQEYQHTLLTQHQNQLAEQFNQVAQHFEESYYGNQPLSHSTIESALTQSKSTLNALSTIAKENQKDT